MNMVNCVVPHLMDHSQLFFLADVVVAHDHNHYSFVSCGVLNVKAEEHGTQVVGVEVVNMVHVIQQVPHDDWHG